MNISMLKFAKIIAVGIALGTTACVSVALKKEPVVKSDRYTYSAPSGIFKSVDPDNADVAWRNPKTGNTIAVISECTTVRDPELTTLENESLSALTSTKILSSNRMIYNDREALRSLAEGNVDGVPVKMDVVNFKKSTCIYSLTYFGMASSFASDKGEFETFVKWFNAQ